MSQVGRSIAPATEPRRGRLNTDRQPVEGERLSAAHVKGAVPAPGPTVASLIKRYTPDYVAKHRPHIASHVESTLVRLGFCRTAPMGGRTYECKACGTTASVYNSCTDRHCPQCSGARRGTWLKKAAEILLPGVTYFQVVFTLPDKLSSLILGNRAELYRLLMQTAAAALQERLGIERDMQAASLLVLHTWNQRLEHHPHVHALVPGSGVSLDGQRWIPCNYTQAAGSQPAKPILVHYASLSEAFSRRFLIGLDSLKRHGRLQLAGAVSYLQDPQAWKQLTSSLTEQAWCVFIQPPPTAQSTPVHVLKYLARYMTGGPISDRRLVGCEKDVVTFMARKGGKDQPKEQVRVRLSGPEFVRNWCLHILPRGFTKTRCYGGFSGRRRRSFLALCRKLCPPPQSLHQPDSAPVEQASAAEETVISCPRCQASMSMRHETSRPSWRELFYGPYHQPWFES